MDEEDGQVLPLEVEAERRAREEALDNYNMDCELDAMAVGVNIDDWDKGSFTRSHVFYIKLQKFTPTMVSSSRMAKSWPRKMATPSPTKLTVKTKKQKKKSLKKRKRRKWTLTRKFKKSNRHLAKKSSGPLMFPYHLR